MHLPKEHSNSHYGYAQIPHKKPNNAKIMKKILSFIGILGFTLAVSSCVSKKQFTDLQTNYTQLQTKHSALQEEYNGAKVKLAEYTSDSKSLAARLAEEQQRNRSSRRHPQSCKAPIRAMSSRATSTSQNSLTKSTPQTNSSSNSLMPKQKATPSTKC